MFLSILKKAMPLPKLLKQQKFLFVGPHPDDIEVACGSTVAKLVKMGKQVTFLVVTDGRVGAVDKSLTEEQIVAIRQQEASKSAELLGVSNLIMLPYHDGGDYDLASVKKDIVSVILQTQPDVVTLRWIPHHRNNTYLYTLKLLKKTENSNKIYCRTRHRLSFEMLCIQTNKSHYFSSGL